MESIYRSKYLNGQVIILWTLVFSFIICGVVYFLDGITEASIRANIRYTARVSYFLFSLAFVASALTKIFKNKLGRHLLKNRRYLGLSFGASHIVHLINIFILLFAIYDGDINGLGGWVELAPSIALYLLIFVMMLTSNNYSMKILGKYWTWLHRPGMYFIAGGLGIGFYKAIEIQPLFYGSLLAILLIQLVLRFYSISKK